MTRVFSKSIAFWTLTSLFAALMVFSGVMYVAGAPMIQQALGHLGYPAYLLTILGTAKLIGAVALVQPRWRTLREWAYAGFSIDLIGAVASHLLSGDPLGIAAVPGAFLVLLAASYILQPAARRPAVTRTHGDMAAAA
jgi:hypothetical protein